MIAAVEAWRAGLFARAHWLRNLTAGVIVGVVALPLGMAFAIASGVKPEQGLYTAIVAGLAVSLFGGSRLQIAGPTGAFVVILAAVSAEHGVQGLMIATLMAGAMLVLLGAARLGTFIRFIPNPVIIGFTAGIGVIIFVGQWRDFFGLPAVTGEHFHEKFWHLLLALPDAHVATTAIASASLALLIIGPWVPGLRKVPGPLLALCGATLLQALFQFEGVATIGSAFGELPRGLPTPSFPDISIPQIITLMAPAFTIAMLGAIESLLSAVVADGMTDTRHDPNQELIGQGIANLLTPLFGGFAATGAIARTATSIRNGASSPLAGVVHALTLVLVLLFLAPLASNIPLAALAAILFIVAWNMSEVRHVVGIIRRAPAADVAVLAITFVLTVFVDLVVAVNIGVIVATLHFLGRMSSSVEVQEQTPQDLAQELADHQMDALPPGVLVYAVEGPFFFGAVETLERVLAHTATDPAVLVIRLRWVPFMDATGLLTLESVIRKLRSRGVVVMLTGANARVTGKLIRAGIPELLGAGNFLPSFGDALARLKADASPAASGGTAG
jgi:sulfate permease, SulP family